MHLDVPAEVGIVQLETPEAGDANGPKRAQILDIAPVDPAQGARDEGVPESRVSTHTALAGNRLPLSNDQIGSAGQDRIHEMLGLRRREKIIGVDKQQNLGQLLPGKQHPDTGLASAAIARPSCPYDRGATVGRDRGRAVRRAVIHDDRPRDPSVGEPIEQLGQAVGLVSGRDERSDRQHILYHVDRDGSGRAG